MLRGRPGAPLEDVPFHEVVEGCGAVAEPEEGAVDAVHGHSFVPLQSAVGAGQDRDDGAQAQDVQHRRHHETDDPHSEGTFA